MVSSFGLWTTQIPFSIFDSSFNAHIIVKCCSGHSSGDHILRGQETRVRSARILHPLLATLYKALKL